MTKLNGTEKQIAWAEDIKKEMLNGIIAGGTVIVSGIIQSIEKAEKDMIHYQEKCIVKGKDLNTHIGYSGAKRKFEAFTELKKEVETQEEATWFIDNRNIQKLFADRM